MTRCTPGDLAVVISALNRDNLGRIVRVVAIHDGSGNLRYEESAGPVWLVESSQPMTWRYRGEWYRRKTGPVPDSQLQPIRGDRDRSADDVHKLPLEVVEQAEKAIGAVSQCRWHQIYDGHLSDAPGRSESWTESVAYLGQDRWLFCICSTDFLGFERRPPEIERMTTAQVIDWAYCRDSEDRESEWIGREQDYDDDEHATPGARTVALLEAAIAECASRCVELLQVSMRGA